MRTGPTRSSSLENFPEAGLVLDLEGGALGQDVERQATHVQGVVILAPRNARGH